MAGAHAEEPERKRQRRATEVVERLTAEHPDARCALDHDSALQLLIATILSAQCTDARVNMVTPALFERFPTAAELAAAPREEVEELIRSTGFYRNKAKSIQGAATRLTEVFDGKVPKTMEELLTLPGVARKTANVVLGTWFGIADGFVVDTHVNRLSHRLGLAFKSSPEQIERELMALIPRDAWVGFAHVLIHHGRRVCSARAPKCSDCVVTDSCPKIDVPETKPASEPKPRVPLAERIAAGRRKK